MATTDRPLPTAETPAVSRVSLLARREIEARILVPLVRAMEKKFGRDAAHALLRQTICSAAHRQGRQLRVAAGDGSLTSFARIIDRWQEDDALHLDMLHADETRLAFDVTRCRYAELYRRLGVPDLGPLLSCSRDAALIRGFNPQVTLTRTRTIMAGAARCDFRFALQPAGGPDG